MIKQDYILPEGEVKITEETYRKLSKLIEETVNEFISDGKADEVSVEKMLEYYFMVRCMMEGAWEKLN